MRRTSIIRIFDRFSVESPRTLLSATLQTKHDEQEIMIDEETHLFVSTTRGRQVAYPQIRMLANGEVVWTFKDRVQEDGRVDGDRAVLLCLGGDTDHSADGGNGMENPQVQSSWVLMWRAGFKIRCPFGLLHKDRKYHIHPSGYMLIRNRRSRNPCVGQNRDRARPEKLTTRSLTAQPTYAVDTSVCWLVARHIGVDFRGWQKYESGARVAILVAENWEFSEVRASTAQCLDVVSAKH